MASSDKIDFSWPVIRALYKEALQAENGKQEQQLLAAEKNADEAGNSPIWLSQPVDLRRVKIEAVHLPVGRPVSDKTPPEEADERTGEETQTTQTMAAIAESISKSRAQQQAKSGQAEESPSVQTKGDDTSCEDPTLITEIEQAFARFIQNQIKAELKLYISGSSFAGSSGEHQAGRQQEAAPKGPDDGT